MEGLLYYTFNAVRSFLPKKIDHYRHMPYKSPEDPSKANPFTVWDRESESKTNSRTFLGQFVLVKNQIPPPLWFQKYYPSCKCIQKKRAFGPSWQYRYSSIIVQVVIFPLTNSNNETIQYCFQENNVQLKNVYIVIRNTKYQ